VFFRFLSLGVRNLRYYFNCLVFNICIFIFWAWGLGFMIGLGIVLMLWLGLGFRFFLGFGVKDLSCNIYGLVLRDMVLVFKALGLGIGF